MARAATAPTARFQTPNVNGGGQQGRQVIPFRQATVERALKLTSYAGNMSAALQPFENNLDGSGYIYGIDLQASVVTAGNSAAVAYAEDAPFSFFDTIVAGDDNGELINCSGYSLYLWNLVNREYANRWNDQSSDVNNFLQTAGTGATGGSTTFWLRVPFGINRRSLLGVLANQDRSQKYRMRLVVGAQSALYTVNPTAAGAFTVNRYYQNYSVPGAVGPDGSPQAVFPPGYPTIHYVTQALSDAAPNGGGNVPHFLRRIGNTLRFVILVLRSNGSRSTAQTNAPTAITFKVGEDPVFTEDYWSRRRTMYDRWGFDFPNGVLVYDALHDLLPFAGGEIGDDWYNTQAVNNAAFNISYPAGFGSTNNSLTIISDELQRPDPRVVSVSA